MKMSSKFLSSDDKFLQCMIMWLWSLVEVRVAELNLSRICLVGPSLGQVRLSYSVKFSFQPCSHPVDVTMPSLAFELSLRALFVFHNYQGTRFRGFKKNIWRCALMKVACWPVLNFTWAAPQPPPPRRDSVAQLLSDAGLWTSATPLLFVSLIL